MDYKDPMIGRMNMHKPALENVSIFISSFLLGFIFGEGSYSFFLLPIFDKLSTLKKK